MANTRSMTYGDFPGVVRKAWYTGRQVGATFIRPDFLKTLNDTRPIVNYDLAVGDIVQLDPFTPQPTTAQPSAALATTQAGLNATIALGACVGAPNIGALQRGASRAADLTVIATAFAAAPADIGANELAIQPRCYVVTHVNNDVNRRSDPTNANANFAQQRDGGWIDVMCIGTTEALFFKNTDILVPAGSPLCLYQPGTSAAIGGQILFGSSTANTGKPALHNLLDASSMDSPVTLATFRNVIDALSRIQGILAESVDTAANGGGAASTTSLRRVSVGGLFAGFGS